ncbi:unnamed protein product, partial [Staurois parvus]
MIRDCGHSTGMTRDCRHSTGDDQRLQTQYRDDQRLRTQYRDDQRLVFDLTCSSIQPRAVFPASVMALGMTAGCPVRMSE